MQCEGPIDTSYRQRWICRGDKTSLSVDIFKRALAFKRWCVEGAVIRGVRLQPIPEGCFLTHAEAENYVKSVLAQKAPTLSGLCGCRRKR